MHQNVNFELFVKIALTGIHRIRIPDAMNLFEMFQGIHFFSLTIYLSMISDLVEHFPKKLEKENVVISVLLKFF